jgi:hypothetical protein
MNKKLGGLPGAFNSSNEALYLDNLQLGWKIPVLWSRIHRIHIFFILLDPDPDPLVRGTDPQPDPDPSIIKQKK